MEGHPDQNEDIAVPDYLQNIDISASLPRLDHRFHLTSAPGYPIYSNYTVAFKDLLDYIYVEEGVFETIRVAPFPSEDELSRDVALPSRVFPSDHMPIAVDIRWKLL